jgi:hypothetical protein
MFGWLARLGGSLGWVARSVVDYIRLQRERIVTTPNYRTVLNFVNGFRYRRSSGNGCLESSRLTEYSPECTKWS